MATKAAKRVASKRSSKVVLFSVLRYENQWQTTIPNHLLLGNDGKLYLTRNGKAPSAGVQPLPVTLKESVAWFRLLHECSLQLDEGEKFSDWLKLIEKRLG